MLGVSTDHRHSAEAAVRAEVLPGERSRVRWGVRQGLLRNLAISVPAPGEGSHSASVKQRAVSSDRIGGGAVPVIGKHVECKAVRGFADTDIWLHFFCGK